MNQKELNELRRRFKPDRTAISKVYGCYVSSSRQIISYVDAPLTNPWDSCPRRSRRCI